MIKHKLTIYSAISHLEKTGSRTALDAWEHLVNKYPNSDEAGLVKDRITELSEIVVESAKEVPGRNEKLAE